MSMPGKSASSRSATSTWSSVSQASSPPRASELLHGFCDARVAVAQQAGPV